MKGEDIAMEEKLIGYVSDYFRNISVAAVEITSGIVSVGDTIHFKGHTTDFKLQVNSMQIEHESVTEAKQGDSIGLKVSEKVRKGDKVYKIIEE
jgi:putative protease